MTISTFRDRDQDTMEIGHALDGRQVRITSRQKVGGEYTTVLIFNPSEAQRIRDKLIEMFPLPVQCAEVVHHDEPEPTSFGELAAFASAQGVTINIANLTINS